MTLFKLIKTKTEYETVMLNFMKINYNHNTLLFIQEWESELNFVLEKNIKS